MRKARFDHVRVVAASFAHVLKVTRQRPCTVVSSAVASLRSTMIMAMLESGLPGCAVLGNQSAHPALRAFENRHGARGEVDHVRLRPFCPAPFSCKRAGHLRPLHAQHLTGAEPVSTANSNARAAVPGRAPRRFTSGGTFATAPRQSSPSSVC
jgi:hypothetical protein